MKPGQIATAREIVANPDRHTARVRYLAWIMLKTAQGHPVRQAHLPPVPTRRAAAHPLVIPRRLRVDVAPTGGDAA